LFYPLLATDFFNSNKGIVTAQKLGCGHGVCF
jgi:hypothetical protein